MAITFVWDASFESSPASSLSRSQIDDEIRLTKRGIRERMEVEHDWGPFGTNDTGYHLPGATSVCDKGNEAARDALSNPQEGSMYLVSDGALFAIYVYLTVGGWTAAGGGSHGGMTGRDDNDHPHYLLVDGGSVAADFDLNGNLLISPEASLSTFNGWVLQRHMDDDHPSLGNIAAVEDGSISLDKLTTDQSSTTTSIGANSYIEIDWPDNVFMFFPSVYILDNTFTKDIRFAPGMNGSKMLIVNESGSSYNVRIRLEWIE